jgi:hypothetical protein
MAARFHRARAARYELEEGDVEAVNAAHADHKAELNRKRGATFRARHQGPEMRAANREKTARYRARKKAAEAAAEAEALKLLQLPLPDQIEALPDATLAPPDKIEAGGEEKDFTRGEQLSLPL